MLRLNNITPQYGTVEILRNVSIEVNDGEIVTLLGANGAGKTTLLNTIIGIVRPISGEIYLDDERLDNMKTCEIIKSGISMVTESNRLFPELNVLENLRIGCLYVKEEKEITANIKRVYDLFPRLLERVNQPARTLSGGEQGMLAIGRALMGSPKILLLDEPSLGLAPMLVDSVFEAIEKINKEGTTILLIEQNAYKSLGIATRGYALQKGQIITEGSVKELRNNEVIRRAYLSI